MVQPSLCGRCGAPLGAGAAACAFCGVGFVGAVGGAPSGPPNADRELVELVRKGNKIGAIKVYRDRTKCSLLAAKEAIDALEKQLGL